jgi:hypothetical protein
VVPVGDPRLHFDRRGNFTAELMKPKAGGARRIVRRWGAPLAYVAGGFVAATAVALVEERGQHEIVQPTRSPEPARALAPADGPHAPLALARAPIAIEPVADLFPPPAAPPSPPMPHGAPAAARPKPQAPPFAYSYLGRMEENGVTRLLLARGDALLIVGLGEKIEGGFRLDRLDDDSITVSHPATGTKRTLSIDALAAQRVAPVATAPVYGAPVTPPGYGYVPQPPPVDPPVADTAPPEPVFTPPAAPQAQGMAPGASSDAGSFMQGNAGVGGVTMGNGGMTMESTGAIAPQPVVPMYGQSGTR